MRIGFGDLWFSLIMLLNLVCIDCRRFGRRLEWEMTSSPVDSVVNGSDFRLDVNMVGYISVVQASRFLADSAPSVSIVLVVIHLVPQLL